MVDISRMPDIAMFKVRGMGVAERVSTSTLLRISLKVSLCVTPKRCSSSMMHSPRSLNLTSFCTSRWVPMMTSTWPRRSSSEHLLLLARGAKAREDIHLDRESLHPVAEGLVVLPGQDGGGHQDGALLAVHHALEGRADGHLGLAEADIAAQQAVHRHRALHVGLDLLDAAQLVVGLVVGEAPLKVVLPVGVLPEGVALGGLALGVELDQLVCHVLDRLFDPRRGSWPTRRSLIC